VVTDPRSLHQKSNPNNGAMCMQLPFAMHLVGCGITSMLRVNHICMGQANVDAPLDSSMPPNHSFKNRTGSVVQPEKTGTGASAGLLSAEDRTRK
jgi:hypothetical protein